MTSTMRLRLLVVLATAVPLAACGGSSDKEKITRILTDGGRRPATICDHLDRPTLARLGGRAKCLKASRAPDAKDPNVKVESVKVSGDKATARITGKSGRDTVHLIKQDGGWKISGA
jgi:hypothetical protein